MTEAALSILQQGMALHRAGRLDEARAIYEQILAQNPAHADSLHLLGLIELDQKRHEQAELLVRRAIAEQGSFHIFHNTLGNILKAQRKYADAAESYERAITLKHDFTEPLNNLGACLLSLSQFDKAEKYFQQAITANPINASAVHNMAIIAEKTQQFDKAIRYYRRIAELRPGVAELYISLANLLHATKNLEEASGFYKKALELKPDAPDMLFRLGEVSLKQEKYDDAMSYYVRLSQIRPDGYSYGNIATVFQNSGNFKEAIVYYNKALELQPDAFEFLNNLSFIYKGLGQLDESIRYLKLALAAAPDNPTLYSNLLVTMIYAPSASPEEVADIAKEFGKRFADPLLRKTPHGNDKNPDRKLRIGYVSPDFRNHSVSYFIEPLLKLHDRKHFEVYAYAYLKQEDEVTARIKKEFDHWRDIYLLNADNTAALIEKDQIDILIDLAGHTGHNSLLAFARKPAPVQLTWMGHPTTTGMKAMDYRVTDVFAEPEGMTEHLNVETLWRLPEIFSCYQPRENGPGVIDHPPFEDNGFVTFGCFNNFTKVTDEVLNVWSKVLGQVPNSCLLLEIAAINEPAFRADVEERLRRAGIPLERVILEPRQPSNQYVLYNKIDIALDPFPCNGGTTSFDTLWMGAPFVALEGKHFVSRMGVTILTNAGLSELIAKNTGEYVKIAADLANDRDRLKNLRHGLREKAAASPLMDQQRFVGNMESAYRDMWRKWCGQ